MADFGSFTQQRRMSVTLRGRDAQAELGRLLETISEREDLNKAPSSSLSAHRDVLLRNLPSGEIRVKDAEKPVEARV